MGTLKAARSAASRWLRRIAGRLACTVAGHYWADVVVTFEPWFDVETNTYHPPTIHTWKACITCDAKTETVTKEAS